MEIHKNLVFDSYGRMYFIAASPRHRRQFELHERHRYFVASENYNLQPPPNKTK